MPVRLVLYGKPHCHLCEVALEAVEDVLDELDGRVEATLEKVDIMRDPELYARLRLDIPVLEVDGARVFIHRIDPGLLLTRLLGQDG